MRTRLLAVAVTALAFALSIASPAQAHDEFLGSDPADESTISSAPESVTLTFSGPPLDVGTTVLVVDENGTNHAADDVDFRGNEIVVGLSDTASAGRYEVRWRTVSADAHAINGTFSFTVAETASASPTPNATTAPSTPAPDTETSSEQDDNDSSGLLPWVIGGSALILLALGLLLLRSRRERTGTSK